MNEDMVIDVLSMLARELMDLDRRQDSGLLVALTELTRRDGSSPYLEAIADYAEALWMKCSCGEDTADELFTLTAETWGEAYPNGGPRFNNVCVSCLEDRLERDLEPADFADDEVNAAEAVRSPRLIARMSG
jgi:hypothetical protein